MHRIDSAGRTRTRLLLATSSLAALLVAGGAPRAFAACSINDVGGTFGPVSNSAAINCINVQTSTVNGNVTNTGAGALTTNATAIVINGSMINGSVVNAGTITATGGFVGKGIDVFNNSTVTAGISNSGSISATGFGATGIFVESVSTFGGGINNSGTISLSGVAAAGVDVTGVGSFNGGITNASAGTITAAALFEAYGIDVMDTSTFMGGISNAGTISLTGGIAGGIVAGATSFFGGISNSGAIFAVASGTGNAVGIDAAMGSTFSGGIGNSGTISASGGKISVGIAVGLISSFSGGIGNAATGTISAGDTGIFLDVANFSGGIANAGHITAGAKGIAVATNTALGATTPITSFSGGISNVGTVTAGKTGVLVEDVSTFSGGINNSGTISAGDNGIDVIGVSAFSGGISNSGTISAGDNGINVVFGTTFSGGITNAGTISAGQEAIEVENVTNFAGGIGNSGTITASSDYGIYVEAVTTFSGGITNSGTITAGLDGILVQSVAQFSGSSAGGGITNSGTISAADAAIEVETVTSFAGGIGNAGTITAGYGIVVNGVTSFAGGIGNSGAISAAAGAGILVSSVTQFGAGSAGGITNSGTITAGFEGIDIASVATFAGNISNSGTIAAQNGILIASGVTFASGAAIVNSGTISGSVAAINVSNATSLVTIDQTAGLISGNILLSANADVLNISGGTINGDIAGGGGVATQDTINFNLGSGTFTYGAAYGFTTINQVNVNSGTVILDGENNATATTVYGGTLQIGDAANPGASLTSTVDVDGGILSGHGTIAGAVTINAGGTLEPGGSIGTLTIANGPLTFAANSVYAIELNDTAASDTVVNGAPGTAIINGGTVVAMPQYTTLGVHGGTTFTIITTTGGRTGTFAAVTSNDPNFTGTFSLSYNADDVFLDVGKGYQILPLTPGLTVNQHDVVTGINNAIMTGVTIPSNFQTLNGLAAPSYRNALTQLDGEVATGAQVGAFQLGDEFLNLMLNQFVDGGNNTNGGGNGGGCGPNLGSGNAGSFNLGSGNLCDYLPVKAPPAGFDQRWSVWGAGYGGSDTTNGDPTGVGSTNVTAGTYGYAAGMNYHALPNTIVGFALAGGGTNWGLADALGTGRSDALQAGVYGITWRGPAYLAGSLAFGNYWFNTDRTALGDQLTANFIGQSYSARFEGGYRYAVLPTLGVTPYAAVELQDFHTPSYSETDLTGGGFGLAYNALSATDVRTELGARFDAPTLAYGKPLVLYGRLAWAHDFVSDPSLTATFESLPGSGFTVFGAPIPHNSALTTLGAQLFLTSNWSLIGTFNGQFADGSQTYEGWGTLRYTW